MPKYKEQVVSSRKVNIRSKVAAMCTKRRLDSTKRKSTVALTSMVCRGLVSSSKWLWGSREITETGHLRNSALRAWNGSRRGHGMKDLLLCFVLKMGDIGVRRKDKMDGGEANSLSDRGSWIQGGHKDTRGSAV